MSKHYHQDDRCKESKISLLPWEREIIINDGSTVIITEEGIFFSRVGSMPPILDDPDDCIDRIKYGKLHPIVGEGGEKYYPVRCRSCGLHFHAAKSILHNAGYLEHGSGTCQCGVLLNLRYDPETETITSFLWDDHIAWMKRQKDDPVSSLTSIGLVCRGHWVELWPSLRKATVNKNGIRTVVHMSSEDFKHKPARTAEIACNMLGIGDPE